MYPKTWPKPNPYKPKLVQSRVTEAQKQALYRREISTRELARQLGTHEKYLSTLFPGKEMTRSKSDLIKARVHYRITLAKQVLEGKYTIGEASKIAYVSYSTMQRFFAKAKRKYPELLVQYKLTLRQLRQESAQEARGKKSTLVGQACIGHNQ